MVKNLKGINPIFYLFAIITVWDIITTLFGTVFSLGSPSLTSMVTGILVSLFVAALIFLTFDIWSHSMYREDAFVRNTVRIVWLVAVIYDIVTAFFGNAMLMNVKLSDPRGIFVLCGMTLLLCFSSFMAAFMYDKHKRGSLGGDEY